MFFGQVDVSGLRKNEASMEQKNLMSQIICVKFEL